MIETHPGMWMTPFGEFAYADRKGSGTKLFVEGPTNRTLSEKYQNGAYTGSMVEDPIGTPTDRRGPKPCSLTAHDSNFLYASSGETVNGNPSS
jgi:hypothetical protein